MKPSIAITVTAALLLSSCAVGPNYARPSVPCARKSFAQFPDLLLPVRLKRAQLWRT